MSVDYYTYLRSTEWQVVRRLALERAAGRCQVCNQPGQLDVHHRTYERLGRELLCDVTVLCRACHTKHHDKLAVAPAIVEDHDTEPDDGLPEVLGFAEEALQARIAREVFLPTYPAWLDRKAA